MKTIKIEHYSEIPENYTGIAEYPSGTKSWWFDGKLHRTDGPAIEYPDGEKRWYKEGKIHREDGPAIIRADGKKSWYKNGKRHREDGPARIWGRYKSWYLEDQDYEQINLNDFVVLGYDKGKFGIIWYRLLDKDKIIEYPDIPGLITK